MSPFKNAWLNACVSYSMQQRLEFVSDLLPQWLVVWFWAMLVQLLPFVYCLDIVVQVRRINKQTTTCFLTAMSVFGFCFFIHFIINLCIQKHVSVLCNKIYDLIKQHSAEWDYWYHIMLQMIRFVRPYFILLLDTSHKTLKFFYLDRLKSINCFWFIELKSSFCCMYM